jgi:hypothetical protein
LELGVKNMKNQLWVATFAVLLGAAACNETVGDCYPVGQSTGNGDPGGGVIASGAGAGPSGDMPTGQAQEALNMDQCNAPPDPTELSERVCGKPIWGMGCQALCKGDGVDCFAGRLHPKNSEGGFGLLSGCCGCKGKQKCTYFYPNTGDSCTFDGPLFLNMFATCVP